MTAKSERTVFFTLVSSATAARNASLLIDSLCRFGGWMNDCPIWVFQPAAFPLPQEMPADENIQFLPFDIEDRFQSYTFSDKVFACARAEEMAEENVRTLVWLSPQCLIVNSPVHFDLAPDFDAALRPVHIKNIGIRADEPMDGYWQAIYERVGLQETSLTVETFVEVQEIKPYFNSHLFSIDPSMKLLREWAAHFREMILDEHFQADYCRDVPHQVFLHQAILSALIVKILPWERIRTLPPEYSYPLHFQNQIPPSRRADTLNELVCPVYEDVFQYPDTLGGIEVYEPLKSWLESQNCMP